MGPEHDMAQGYHRVLGDTMRNAERQTMNKGAPEQIIWPVQCSCGHLFLEKYLLPKPNDNGEVGFCWCGFCQTRLNVKAQTWE